MNFLKSITTKCFQEYISKPKMREWMIVLFAICIHIVSIKVLTSTNDHHTKFAYIDPGFGAMILQAAAVAFLGALFYIRQTRDAIVRFFKKILGKPIEDGKKNTDPIENNRDEKE